MAFIFLNRFLDLSDVRMVCWGRRLSRLKMIVVCRAHTDPQPGHETPEVSMWQHICELVLMENAGALHFALSACVHQVLSTPALAVEGLAMQST